MQRSRERVDRDALRWVTFGLGVVGGMWLTVWQTDLMRFGGASVATLLVLILLGREVRRRGALVEVLTLGYTIGRRDALSTLPPPDASEERVSAA